MATVLRALRIALAGTLFWVIACAPEGPPNLVLVTLDTFRADRLGALGHPGGLTPHLDELASESALFTRAVTPIGTTHPAHASLFTGLYPSKHRVRFNGQRLEPAFVTLAELLRDAGYRTAAFVAMPTMLTYGGLAQGFETTSDHGRLFAPTIRPGAQVNRMAIDWLRQGGEGPIFLWVHYYETHSPYKRTAHFRAQLARLAQSTGTPYRGPLRRGASAELFVSYGSEALPATEENRRLLGALYDGEVIETDRLVGELLDALDKEGRLDHAVVAVVADHGQMLGEHGRIGHGYHLFEPVLQVPLLIWESQRRDGRVIDPRVSLIDLLPTLAELTAVAPPADLPGRSLAPAMRGEPLPEAEYFASVRVPRVKGRQRGKKAREQTAELLREKRAVAVYHGAKKLMLDRDGARLFDLQTDPGEEHPVTGEEARELIERLRELAVAHEAEDPDEAAPIELPKDVRLELEELGYLR
jgi:arylsulfatase A-like enzyme